MDIASRKIAKKEIRSILLRTIVAIALCQELAGEFERFIVKMLNERGPLFLRNGFDQVLGIFGWVLVTVIIICAFYRKKEFLELFQRKAKLPVKSFLKLP